MQSPSSHKSMPRQVRRRHKPLDRVDLTGQVVAGRYAVTGLLGHGSMGFVYRAVDQNLKSDVVIKVPAEDRLENPGFLERFHRESSFLVRLRHPHIISILDAGQVEDVPYFVMQYVGGGSLEDRQRQQDGMRRPMSRRSLAQWLPQIGAALDFMHSQDCVHRDVKPANILFDDHGNPYLSDFGLSKVVLTADEDSSSTAAGAVVGTPNYVAPELVLGRDFDGQADQYSLAVTVYEILSGIIPFEGPTASATMVNQTRVRPRDLAELNPRIPAALSAAVRRGMSKRPDRRFASCAEFAAAVLKGAMPPSSSSSQSVLSNTSTVTIQAPSLISDGKRKVKGNRVACKSCKQQLEITAKHGGKKGRCGGCGQRIAVSKNAKSVEFLIPLDAQTPLGASTDAQYALVFSQKAFGYDFNTTQALIVVGVLLLFIIVGATVATSLMHHDPDAIKKLKVESSGISREGG